MAKQTKTKAEEHAEEMLEQVKRVRAFLAYTQQAFWGQGNAVDAHLLVCDGQGNRFQLALGFEALEAIAEVMTFEASDPSAGQQIAQLKLELEAERNKSLIFKHELSHARNFTIPGIEYKRETSDHALRSVRRELEEDRKCHAKEVEALQQQVEALTLALSARKGDPS